MHSCRVIHAAVRLKNFISHIRREFDRRLSLLRNGGPDLAQPATYAGF